MEGYIKFNCEWIKNVINLPKEAFEELNRVRSNLYNMGLVGMDENGIGFGNLSFRIDGDCFAITGTRTGAKAVLQLTDISIVEDVIIERNYLRCRGLVPASSESLTHAGVYISRKSVKAVIHIHSEDLWQFAIGMLPSTSKDAEYGTVRLAWEVRDLAKRLNDRAALVLLGHRPGLLFWGQSMQEVFADIVGLYEKSK